MPPITDYCSKDDLGRFGISREALRTIAPTDLDSAIRSTSSLMDSYLGAPGSSIVLPLTVAGQDLVECAAVMAVYTLISARGYNPQDPAHETLRQRYEDKLAWLKMISLGTVIPSGIVDSGTAESASSGSVKVVSNEQRGWFQDINNPLEPEPGPFTGARSRGF